MNKASRGDRILIEIFQILKDAAAKLMQSICQKIWKSQQWSQDWKRSVFIPTPKKGNGTECSSYQTIALISRTIKRKESEVIQSCSTLCHPMDCSLPGSSVHGIFQAEYWSGLPFPSPDLPELDPDWTQVSHIVGRHFTIWVTREVLKILQARLQQYMNHELPDVKDGFRKGRGTRDRIFNIHWIIEKAREFQKNIYFCFIDYTKAFDCVITTNWKVLQEVGLPEHLTCLLRNLYAGQEPTVRTGHEMTPNWERSTSRVYVVTLFI